VFRSEWSTEPLQKTFSREDAKAQSKINPYFSKLGVLRVPFVDAQDMLCAG
jgi:hypothetical protein